MNRTSIRIALLSVCLALTPSLWADNLPADGSIWLLDIDGGIGPATSDYIVRSIDEAEAARASLVIIRMNTPGGLDSSMRDIIARILASDVAVATFVAPGGSRAASAGTYILYASHIAAMAPATNLGAATPVQIGMPGLPSGTPDESEEKQPVQGGSAMEKKMINDASAYIRGLAELRGRNIDWAELAVREARSLSSTEALENGVIDLVADNLDELISRLDNREVVVSSGPQTLKTAGRPVYEHAPDWRTELLAVITNPSLVMILGLIGVYGIILEFYNPGSLVPGIVGVICLVLAGYALQLLPLNMAGLALLLLGIGLMVAEALVPSFGVLGIAGVISFSIGGVMLFDTDVETFQVGFPVIIAVAMVAALLIFATISIAMKIRRNKVAIGIELIVGEQGLALEDFGREGQVRVGSEIWRARSEDEIKDGDDVKVLAVDGLLLQVGKL